MNVCVIGAGFTGILTALILKKNCPSVTITLIDSNKEPKNFGFGESAPPAFMTWLLNSLKVAPEERSQWVTDWLIGTNSTFKYNLKWQNFTSASDDGYVSGVRDMPDFRAILDGSPVGHGMDINIANPDNNAYRMFDLWYELYKAGHRKLEDFQSDTNDLYWLSKKGRVPYYEGRFVFDVMSSHINSFEVCEWLRNKYGDIIDTVVVDTIKDIEFTSSGAIKELHLESGNTTTADFYIDCTGFKRLVGNKANLPFKRPDTDIYHDSVTVVANSYTENFEQEMLPQTVGYGMDYGWTFSIPLLNRKSYGYTYNSRDLTPDQALEELATLSDPATRVIEPIHLKWTPGGYTTSCKENFALVGLSAGFVDPFDANTIGLQVIQLNNLVEFFNDTTKQHLQDRYNEETWGLFSSVAERVEYHFGLAPRSTSPYWERNHQVAKHKRLEDAIFETLNDYKHSPDAERRGRFIPYRSALYLSELVYFDIDMSRRCRNSNPSLLMFAKDFFKTNANLNRARAELFPTLLQWYKMKGIDLKQLNGL